MRVWNFIIEYSVLLVAGALIGLIWANLDYETYHHIVDFVLLKESVVGHLHYDHGEAHRVLTVHYLINDILMAFFFAIAGKEVWEAVALKEGSLRGRRAATPLLATVGGMLGPITVYLGVAALLGSETYSAVANGWAIPTATDIAFSYMVGRIIFGAGHPAVRFLLLLAIADDAAGLIILAVFYPSAELVPEWLLLSLGAVLVVYALFNHLPYWLDRNRDHKPNTTFVRNRLTFWPYAAAGALSWYGFQEAGIHPALGLLPVIPAIPHADRAFGLMAASDRDRRDLLNSIEHKLQYPVEFVLFLFGFANAGVKLSSIGVPTLLVLLGLLVGKPVGILLFGWLGAKPLGFGVPEGMHVVDIAIVGFVAAIGFTVSLFIATVAFEAGAVQDAAKMGALLSLGAAVIALGLSRIIAVKKIP